MAAFFPRTIYNNEASFTPLFRLLDDFDSYSRQCDSSSRGCQPKKQQQQQQKTQQKQQPSFFRRPAASHWQPRFDVRETADAYELHGELPGLNKSDVSIEFTEPQTLVVRGKVERTYAAGSSPNAAAAVEETPAAPAPVEQAPASPTPHQATVADEDDTSIQEENGFEVVSDSGSNAGTPVDNSKYWLTERSIGEFARSFSFPSRVDQDSVSAGFQDGILSISVPKAKKHETIRISIN